MLQSRQLVYADMAAATTLRELCLGFLDGGGYGGAGYEALRLASQRQLTDAIQRSFEISIGPLAVIESGLPALVPLSRRLAKKLGDLLQLTYLLLEGQPARGQAGRDPEGFLAGMSARRFALYMQALLIAFSHGLVFDDEHASSATSADSSGTGLSRPPGAPTSVSAAPTDEARRILHSMRLIAAAFHMYLETVLQALGSPPEPAPSPPSSCRRLRDKLILALAHGPRTTPTGESGGGGGGGGEAGADRSATLRRCEFESRFETMRRSKLALDLLHALCRADVVQQAIRQSRLTTPLQSAAASTPTRSGSATARLEPCATACSIAQGPVAEGPHAGASQAAAQVSAPGCSDPPPPRAPVADAAAGSGSPADAADGIHDTPSTIAPPPPRVSAADGPPLVPGLGEAMMLPLQQPAEQVLHLSSASSKLPATMLNESVIDRHF